MATSQKSSSPAIKFSVKVDCASLQKTYAVAMEDIQYLVLMNLSVDEYLIGYKIAAEKALTAAGCSIA